MEMWFSFDNGNERLQVPVHPGEITFKFGSKNETVSIAGLGDITIIQDKPLEEISFSSYFPAAKDYTWAHPNVHEPQVYIDYLLKWKNSGKPMRFIITETRINMACTIEEFEYSEKAGDVGTYYYNITFREYRFIKPRKLQETKSSKVPTNKTKTVSVTATQQRPSSRTIPSTYTPKQGDSLSLIGRKFGLNWRDIAAVNGMKAPYTIYEGKSIKLPTK
jgi:nucleoid-associated protein YgaU